MKKRNEVVRETEDGHAVGQMTGKDGGQMITDVDAAAVTHGKEGAVGVETGEGKRFTVNRTSSIPIFWRISYFSDKTLFFYEQFLCEQ